MNAANVLIATTVLLGLLFVFGVREAGRRLGLPSSRARRETAIALALFLAWIGVDAALALSGKLAVFDRTPPPFMALVGVSFVLTTLLAFSPLGSRLARGLPLAWLVGFQAFRILAELALFLGHSEGLVPIQMTFVGFNFDIFSGLSAACIGLILIKKPWRILAMTWNWTALIFLTVIVAIAILSFPTPLRMFHNEPANVWVTQFPYVWLPGVLVQFAWLGHLLVFRKLRSRAR